jgi:hypothetical protein
LSKEEQRNALHADEVTTLSFMFPSSLLARSLPTTVDSGAGTSVSSMSIARKIDVPLG